MDTRTLRTGSEIFNKDKCWMNSFYSNSVNIFDQINRYDENTKENRNPINESDGIADSLKDGLQDIYIHGPKYKYPYSVNDPISCRNQYRKNVSSPYKRPTQSCAPCSQRPNRGIVEPQKKIFAANPEDLQYLNIAPVNTVSEKKPVQDLLKFADTTSSTSISFNSQASKFQKKLKDLKTNLEEVLVLLSGLSKVVDDRAIADYEEKVKKVAFLFD